MAEAEVVAEGEVVAVVEAAVVAELLSHMHCTDTDRPRLPGDTGCAAACEPATLGPHRTGTCTNNSRPRHCGHRLRCRCGLPGSHTPAANTNDAAHQTQMRDPSPSSE